MKKKLCAVYVGAGRDVEPIRLLPEVKTFVFVDSLPSTEQPGCIFMRDPLFGQTVAEALAGLGFVEEKKTKDTKDTKVAVDCMRPHARTFENAKTRQTLHYFMSYAFPQNVDFELATHLHACTHVIDRGHHADKVLLDFVPRKFQLLCFPGTYYGADSEEDSIVQELYDRDDLDIVVPYSRFWRRRYSSLRDAHRALSRDASLASCPFLRWLYRMFNWT